MNQNAINQNVMNNMILNNSANQMNHLLLMHMIAENNREKNECVIEQPIVHHKSSVMPKPFAICSLILSIVFLIVLFYMSLTFTK